MTLHDFFSLSCPVLASLHQGHIVEFMSKNENISDKSPQMMMNTLVMVLFLKSRQIDCVHINQDVKMVVVVLLLPTLILSILRQLVTGRYRFSVFYRGSF